MLKEHRTSVPPVAHCLTCREEVKFFEMGRRFARCASMIRRKNVRFVAPENDRGRTMQNGHVESRVKGFVSDCTHRTGTSVTHLFWSRRQQVR